MTDRLHPTGSLTTAELSEARRIARENPAALWPAIKAALCIDDGEATVAGMLEMIREGRPCAT